MKVNRLINYLWSSVYFRCICPSSIASSFFRICPEPPISFRDNFYFHQDFLKTCRTFFSVLVPKIVIWSTSLVILSLWRFERVFEFRCELKPLLWGLSYCFHDSTGFCMERLLFFVPTLSGYNRICLQWDVEKKKCLNKEADQRVPVYFSCR